MQTKTILLIALLGLPLCDSSQLWDSDLNDDDQSDRGQSAPDRQRDLDPSDSWASSVKPSSRRRHRVYNAAEGGHSQTVVSKPITILDRDSPGGGSFNLAESADDAGDGLATIITKYGPKRVRGRQAPEKKRRPQSGDEAGELDDCRNFDPNGNKIRMIMSKKHGPRIVDCRKILGYESSKAKSHGDSGKQLEDDDDDDQPPIRIIEGRGPGKGRARTKVNKRPAGRNFERYQLIERGGKPKLVRSKKSGKKARNWPFFATLTANNQTQACSAVLISPRMALTSRSCSQALTNQTASLRLIMGDRSTGDSCRRTNVVWVDKDCTSTNYTSRPSIGGSHISEWDFRLLKLDQEIVLAQNDTPVSFVNISKAEIQPKKSKNCKLVRQTVDEETGEISVGWDSIEMSSCWGKNETHFCFKGLGQDGDKLSTCSADSGGPIVCRDRESTSWELVGIVASTANRCSPYNLEDGIQNMATNLVKIRGQVDSCVAELESKERRAGGKE